MRGVTIIGGGIAALACVAQLRESGFEGRVTVLAGESELPYDRTLLSKDFLWGDEPPALTLEPASYFRDLDVDMRLGAYVTEVDLGARRIRTLTGDPMHYDRLVVCSGGRAVLPAPLAAPGVLTLRELADARVLRDRLRSCGRVAVVGGGFIGGEIVSAAVQLGVEAVMFEQLQAPLAGVLGERVGGLVADLHRLHGVDVRTGHAIRSIGQVESGYRLEVGTGETVEVDEVVVGVGMTPAVDFLANSGLRLENGIVTDGYGRTSAPGVMAAGDCARWWHNGYQRLLRTEHWETARRHGASVARNLLGESQTFEPVPFFWSDQHDVKYQSVGITAPHTDVELELVDPPHRFIATYRVGNRLVAAFGAGQAERIAAMRHELAGHCGPMAKAPEPTHAVAVDRGLCVGSGNCVRIARGAFRLDVDGVAEVVDPAAATRTSLERAARSCPTGAITLPEASVDSPVPSG